MSQPETLADLMTRLERARKRFQQERDYIRLTLFGGGFIMVGATLSGLPVLTVLLLGLIAMPYAFTWYNLPKIRLQNGFCNEVLPFLLQPYGEWRYALAGPDFPHQLVFASGFVAPGQRLRAVDVITGEHNGTPVVLASISLWDKPFLGLIPRKVPVFSGWAAVMRPSGLPPVGTAGDLPDAWQQRFNALGVRWAVADRSLLLWVEGPLDPFEELAQLNESLAEPAPYEAAKALLAERMALVDRALS